MYPTVWTSLNVNIFPKCVQQKVVESETELSYTLDSRPAPVENTTPTIVVDPKDEKIEFLTSTVASMQSTLMMLVAQQQKGNVNPPLPEIKKVKGKKEPYAPIDEEERTRVEVLRRTIDLVHESDDEDSASDTSDKLPTKEKGESAPKARYDCKKRFKGKPKRDGTLKNWQDGMKRNCTPEAIFQQIEEITVDSLPEALEMMKKVGVAVIRDYDSVIGQPSDSSEDFEPDPDEVPTRQLRTSIFTEGNAPSEEQAMYHERGVVDSKGNKGKPPPMENIFEGVVINSGNWDVGPIRKPPVYKH